MHCAGHVVRCDDDKSCIYDRVVGPLGFGLGVLNFADVLGHSLTFEMVTLNLVIQREYIKVTKSTTSRSQVVEKFPRGNQGVVGLGLFEFTDLHVFDNAEDEFPCFDLHGFISGEVLDAGLVDGLLH